MTLYSYGHYCRHAVSLLSRMEKTDEDKAGLLFSHLGRLIDYIAENEPDAGIAVDDDRVLAELIERFWQAPFVERNEPAVVVSSVRKPPEADLDALRKVAAERKDYEHALIQTGELIAVIAEIERNRTLLSAFADTMAKNVHDTCAVEKKLETIFACIDEVRARDVA
jgi:hypothetical protein